MQIKYIISDAYGEKLNKNKESNKRMQNFI